MGEELVRVLKRKNRNANLTLIDISKKHLDENKNKETTKIVGDVLKVDLQKKFDVVIMRSSLPYFPSVALKVKLLNRIHDWLKRGGVFIHQVSTADTEKDKKMIDYIYGPLFKMGVKGYSTRYDILSLYQMSGFARIQRIGKAPTLFVSEKEHQARYGTTQKEIRQIQAKIRKSDKVKNVIWTKRGYRLTFPFSIYVTYR